LPFAHELFDELVPEERYPDRSESMHVVRRDGSVKTAGDAVIALLWALPSTRLKAVPALLLPSVRRGVRQRYARLAARRGDLSERVEDTELTVVAPRRPPDLGRNRPGQET
jgi:predicted DCC family thiol-disulfide oxidoreductase YuxK